MNNTPNLTTNSLKKTNHSLVNAEKARESKQPIIVPVQGNGTALLDRQVDVPKKDVVVTRRRHWESTHISVGLNGSDKNKLSEREVSVVLNSFSKDQLPWAHEHHAYFQDKDGSLILKKNEHYDGGIRMTVYGIDTNDTPQYVTEQLPSSKKILHHLEAFATSSKKGISQKLRNTYPIATYSSCRGIPQGRGHGIDFILTIPENNHSSIDASNYTPQNRIYNEYVRRLLVGDLIKKPDVSFKEINIYGEKPPQLKQEVNEKYTASKKKETHLIDVPEGFLFLVYDSLQKINKVYYFPNFIDYEKLNKKEGIRYKDMPEIFEIEVPTEKIFGREINLYGVSIYGEEKPDGEVDREVSVKSHVGFRMLLGRYKIGFQKEDKASKWIPLEAREALERTLGRKQLNEMAESEFVSIHRRLTFVEALLTEQNFDAFLWLKRVEEQVAVESTMEEKLQLHDTYLLIKNNYHEIYDDLSTGIKVNEQALLSEIIKQLDEEENEIEDKLAIVDKIEDLILKQYYLEKAEKQIMAALSKIGKVDEETTIEELLERKIAIEELHTLADYYSGLYREEGKGMIDNYRKAHDLYRILIAEFSSTIMWDGILYDNHFKDLLRVFPESINYELRVMNANFFKGIGFEEAALFWDKKAQECTNEAVLIQ